MKLTTAAIILQETGVHDWGRERHLVLSDVVSDSVQG